MAGHNYLYKKWKKGEFHKFTCFDMFDKYGFENRKIVLMEQFEISSKDELIAKEQDYIKNNICVNKVIPGRTHKE